MNVLVVALLLLGGVLISVSANKKLSIGETLNLKSRNLKESISYWWNNKVKGYSALSTSAVYYSSGGRTAKSIPILVYHGIPDEGRGDNPFSSPNFSEQMKALKNDGWQTISLDEFYGFMEGRLNLPEKSFLLTFDDGRKDTYYPADPVLKDLGYKAVMFAITKRSLSPVTDQSSYYLSEFELKEMQKSGRWDIESHGRDSHDWYIIDASGGIGHFFSNLYWLSDESRQETEQEYIDRITYDLLNSKKDLEKVLGKEITAFAFPFSDYGEGITNFNGSQSILLETVPQFYKAAFYQVWHNEAETFNYPNPNQYMMKRIEPAYGLSGEELLLTLNSGIAKDQNYQSSRFGKEWVETWGKVLAGDSLKMEAKENSAGAAASLNGSWWWSDYTFEAGSYWESGSNIVLVARRQDADNYYGCNFAKNKVFVKRVQNGSSFNVVSANYDLASLGKDIALGVSVSGPSIKCLVNGEAVLEGDFISGESLNGGIGIEIWDEKIGTAAAIFDDISVYEN